MIKLVGSTKIRNRVKTNADAKKEYERKSTVYLKERRMEI